MSDEAATPKAPPGWYSHPSMDGTRRYWDGQRWTEHIAPDDVSNRVVTGSSPPDRSSRNWWFWIGIAVTIFVLLGGWSWFSTVLSRAPGVVANYDCGDLAQEAVAISEGQGLPYTLLKVRNTNVVTDNRDTYEEPTGSTETLVLECSGDASWSDGDTTGIALRLTVDSDGDAFVYYEPKR